MPRPGAVCKHLRLGKLASILSSLCRSGASAGRTERSASAIAMIPFTTGSTDDPGGHGMVAATEQALLPTHDLRCGRDAVGRTSQFGRQ